MENIIIPENTNKQAPITTHEHKISVVGDKFVEQELTIENQGTIKEPEYQEKWSSPLDYGDEFKDTNVVQCYCGEPFDNISEAKEHLKNVESVNAGEIRTEYVRKHLKGVSMYGFDFQFNSIAGTFCWVHQDLGMNIYATPNYGKLGVLHIQVDGHDESIFSQFRGQEVHEYGVSAEGLTVEEYLKKIRDFIEENLV